MANSGSNIIITAGAKVVNNPASSNGYKTLNSTAPSVYRQVNGAHVFYGDTGKTVNTLYTPTERMRIDDDGNVGIGTSAPAAPLDVPRASDYKVIKLGDDITSHYVMTGNSDHTLTLTCGSYYQAEIIVTAHQTNGGTYNNLYIRGIWSNNHTSHHWDEIENVGSLTNSTFTITNGQNGATAASGEWKIVHDYVSGTFVKFTVRITDFYGTHAYTIS